MKKGPYSQRLQNRRLIMKGLAGGLGATLGLAQVPGVASAQLLKRKPEKTKSYGAANMFAGRSFKGKKAPKVIFEQWIANPPTSTKGKPILLKFFATWCPVCRRSPPILNRLQDELGSRLTIITLSNEDLDTVVKRYVTPFKVRYPVARDGQMRLYRTYEMRESYPHYVVIDRRGIVRYEGIMPINDYERMKSRIVQKAKL